MIKSFKPLGTGAVLVEWEQIISENILDEIAQLNEYFQQKKIFGIIDILPAYASLTVFFKPEVLKYKDLVFMFKNFEFVHQNNLSHYVKEIQVRYSTETEKDMRFIMNFSGLDRETIVKNHSSIEYRVCFIGFLPGFLYLSGLDSSLHIPRKAVPDLNIKAGSVAIGGQQTGIYPQNSPGGWYVIGHTDFKVIDLYHKPYCTLRAGDRIRFKEI